MMLLKTVQANGMIETIQPSTGRSNQLGDGNSLVTQDASGIQLIQASDAQAVGTLAAEHVAALLEEKPDASIVFPTGKTPLPMYKTLRHWPHLDWRQTRLFHLDEYVPPPQRPKVLPYETYEQYMRRELWDYIAGSKYFLGHYIHDFAAYEQEILKNDGPDLVILGIGNNGHIAFNEPGSSPDSLCRLIDLAPETIQANFGAEGMQRSGYPRQAVTLGMKTILAAKKILLLATGSGKQGITQQAFDPSTPPNLNCPASWLKQHSNLVVLTDFALCF